MSKMKTPDHQVTLIRQPFVNNLADVTEAQQTDDELDIDSDIAREWNEAVSDSPTGNEFEAQPTDSDAQDLARLAKAMTEHSAEYVADLEALSGETEAQASVRLAREIAEDEALTARLAEDEKDQTDPELAAALPKEPRPDSNGELDLSEMQSCIETLLFMADKPLTATKLRELLGPDFPLSIFQEALTLLQDRYLGVSHGIELVSVAGGYQFRTKPGRAALAKKLARIQTQRLSSGAMETIAIIAYRQPALKDDIDKIRGVDSSHFIRTLLDRKLIRISGRSEQIGRPMLYSTTPEFLELFGLKDLGSMPSLRELEQMVPANQTGEDDPRVREMRKLVGEMKSDTSTTLIYDPREDEKILGDMKERISAIPTSSPYLEAQKAAELADKAVAKLARLGALGQAAQQPPAFTPPPPPPVSSGDDVAPQA